MSHNQHLWNIGLGCSSSVWRYRKSVEGGSGNNVGSDNGGCGGGDCGGGDNSNSNSDGGVDGDDDSNGSGGKHQGSHCTDTPCLYLQTPSEIVILIYCSQAKECVNTSFCKIKQ